MAGAPSNTNIHLLEVNPALLSFEGENKIEAVAISGLSNARVGTGGGIMFKLDVVLASTPGTTFSMECILTGVTAAGSGLPADPPSTSDGVSKNPNTAVVVEDSVAVRDDDEKTADIDESDTLPPAG